MPEVPRGNRLQGLKRDKIDENKNKRNKSEENTVQSEEMRYKNADDIYD